MTGDAPQPAEDRTAGPGPDADRDVDEAPAGSVPARRRRPRRRPVTGPPPPARDAVTQPAETTPTVPPRTVLPSAEPADDPTDEPAPALPVAPKTGSPEVAAAPAPAASPKGATPPARAATSEAAVAPNRPELAIRVDGVPDVMVLPEPDHNRPTVSIEPERPRPAPAQATDSALEAARWRMEHSPFWLSEADRDAAEAQPDVDPGRGRPPRPRPQSPRRPLPGLAGLIVFALAAAFFSWVSAEPFWLAVGHGDAGTATVHQCIGSGVGQRCSGSFTAADGGYTVNKVALLGVDTAATREGGTTPARMVAADSRQAYVGTGLLVHLRWLLGFLLVLFCGYGIAGTTGARQLETSRARRHAVLISLAGPALLLAGFLVAAY
ncbi:hypothetical protein [Jidongwangia harbinensis]|uniref:hypothetical protein n=1 Tax=Jidongwangia harbinensis TaxID=2878561 RepID=UPI001CD9D498|nr:hypothetical protein [Jidongwangia harbinensis]MCA2213839.1 hypothetical protein [Jidongwangia harbinensis]